MDQEKVITSVIVFVVQSQPFLPGSLRMPQNPHHVQDERQKQGIQNYVEEEEVVVVERNPIKVVIAVVVLLYHQHHVKVVELGGDWKRNQGFI
ncbi:unnamed protein product [Rodentolepis nana]|uniref:Uncharacterized protein n=1 Tax=Rodentolepis nana TaxID=102285 RepID=A0A0R3TDT2_RODNA|nr:unnamed protein product [Rodentolepis nana]